MAENTAIEWTDHTFNPWMGCTRVSEGCRHCYAETLMDHRWNKVQWGPQGQRIRTSDAIWRQPIKWNERAMREGRRFRVFCASLADVFEDKPELQPWRDEVFALMAYTTYLDWQVLTKRPENVMSMVPPIWKLGGGWPEHVWIGTSIENQEMADKRIPELLKIPAAIRFLSCEPLLGPIDLGHAVGCGYYCDEVVGHVDHPFWTRGIASPIQWVIAGGESGPNARPMHPSWAQSLRDQCQSAGVAFFMKQWGEWVPISDDNPRMTRAGKKNAGRLLDGREWNEFPLSAVMA